MNKVLERVWIKTRWILSLERKCFH